MLVIYQDVVVGVYGVNIWLIRLADKCLFCSSNDLPETFNSLASPYCTFQVIVCTNKFYEGQLTPLVVFVGNEYNYTV